MHRFAVVHPTPSNRLTRGERIAARWPHRADCLALLVLATVTALAAGQLFWGGTLIGQDSATQFYPWYDYLGERLAARDIPGWNPYQFGGAPFAADPQSGWMYLPAMLLFTFLRLPDAVPTFVVVHLALAGFATYALGRVLGLGPAGSLVAGIGYQLAGPIYGRSICCPAQLEVATWAPVALLGAELALRRRDWPGRVGGWTVAGLAVSQGLAAWVGQGAYYLLLALAAFIAWRAILAPPHRPAGWRERCRLAALHGGAILAIGFGLAAAAVLPRLEYVRRTNVDGGAYAGHNSWAAEIGGVTPGMALEHVLEPTLHHPGSALVVLACLSLLLARRWVASSYFIVFGLAALTLATPFTTPLHLALYETLPRFKTLHQHWPERVSMVGYIAFALLAGATVDALARAGAPVRRRAVAAGAPIALLGVLALVGSSMPPASVAALVATAALMGLLLTPRLRPLRVIVPGALALVVAADLLWSFNVVAGRAPYGGFHRVDLASYYAPSGAVAYLRERTADEPGRYIGYDPTQQAHADGQTVLYRYQFADEATAALLVNNRGTLHGLEDVQGYNPVQPKRFVEYLTALNGRPQEYHDANVYPWRISSPLLDLLNVRYIIVPAATPPDRIDLRGLRRELPEVYRDDQVAILENVDALPRAWIVHDALRVGAGEALGLLARGAIDPRSTALLESHLPLLETPTDPTAESVTILFDEPDRIRLATRTDAAGLLLLSETYDPNWRAYIDGRPATTMVANHLLRAVPLPAGDHFVELRYESTSLQAGLMLSVLTAGGLATTLAAFGWRRWAGAAQAHAAPAGARPAGSGGMRTADAAMVRGLGHIDATQTTQGALVWMHLE